ncbi:MAG: hypothetical protein KC731_10595 [Myxococcales bacterium]|nr:hypothetical protein [Myxococcales bacterium]
MASRELPFSPKTTPGKIWCEGEYCDLATESCCIDDSNANAPVTRCVPKGEGCCPGQPMCSFSLSRDCDEDSDCGRGVCCSIPMGESWTAHQCRPSAVGCPATVCLPGSTCRTGDACIAPDPAEQLDLSSFHAFCADQILPPTCGARQCAKGQVCCWSASNKKGTCAESCDDQADVDTIYACTAPSQCASRDCTTALGGQRPARFRCGDAGWVGHRICRRGSECPAEDITAGPGVTKLLGCLHDPSSPPGVRFCKYAEK